MSYFVILDPSLKSFNGHFLNYDRVIARQAEMSGFKSLTLASHEVLPEIEKQIKIIPTFTFGLEDKLAKRQNANRRQHRKVFFRDLVKSFFNIPLDCNSIVFMHTTTALQIGPLLDWISSISASTRPQLVILLRYAPYPSPYFLRSPEAAEYQKIFKEIETSKCRSHIHFVTDSDILKQHYSEFTELSLSVVPIPHSTEVVVDTSIKRLSRNPIPTMTYLGNARSTKGFQYLPFVFHALSDKLKNKLWRAEVQSNVMFTHDLESNVALSLLKKLPVQIYENELSINEYNELLLRSSIVILPYQLLFYHAQTSGVLCEAMSAGKPVIVPRGTWLSQQIQGKKVGVKFCPGDRVSLLEATQTAMNNIDELSESAEQQAKEWSNYHSPENFMKYLLAVTRGGLREL